MHAHIFSCLQSSRPGRLYHAWAAHVQHMHFASVLSKSIRKVWADAVCTRSTVSGVLHVIAGLSTGVAAPDGHAMQAVCRKAC